MAKARGFPCLGFMKAKLNKAVGNHTEKITFYSTAKIDPADFLFENVFSQKASGKRLKEAQSSRGDYYWNMLIDSVKCHKHSYFSNGKTTYKYTYQFGYKLSKSQMKYVDRKCKKVASTAKKKKKAKKKAEYICKWIAKNMSYKVTNKHQLYSPLKSKKGQCKHYAYIFYKIGKDAGLNVRIVGGKAKKNGKRQEHAWCLVKVKNKWYQVDPTWADGGKKIKKKWIMKPLGNKEFKRTHFLDKKDKTILRT